MNDAIELVIKIRELLHKSEADEYVDTGEALDLLREADKVLMATTEAPSLDELRLQAALHALPGCLTVQGQQATLPWAVSRAFEVADEFIKQAK